MFPLFVSHVCQWDGLSHKLLFHLQHNRTPNFAKHKQIDCRLHYGLHYYVHSRFFGFSQKRNEWLVSTSFTHKPIRFQLSTCRFIWFCKRHVTETKKVLKFSHTTIAATNFDTTRPTRWNQPFQCPLHAILAQMEQGWFKYKVAPVILT